jgi:hypothetical protein
MPCGNDYPHGFRGRCRLGEAILPKKALPADHPASWRRLGGEMGLGPQPKHLDLQRGPFATNEPQLPLQMLTCNKRPASVAPAFPT